jgi:hypothetical protein
MHGPACICWANLTPFSLVTPPQPAHSTAEIVRRRQKRVEDIVRNRSAFPKPPPPKKQLPSTLMSYPLVAMGNDGVEGRSRPEGKIYRVDPDFGSTLTVSSRDYQSKCWVNWKILGQPCGFQVLGAAADRGVALLLRLRVGLRALAGLGAGFGRTLALYHSSTRFKPDSLRGSVFPL